MNWEAIGAVGEIFGALAVFVSLVYLGVQTRQNTRALKSSAFHQVRESFSDVSLALVQDPSLITLLGRINKVDPSLTEEDIARYNFFLTTFLRRGESAYFQSSQGALEQESWFGIRQTIIRVLSNQHGRDFWDSESGRFTSEYVSALNTELSKSNV